MQKDLIRRLRDPNLIPPEKQTLLSSIAVQAAAMNMPCYLVGGFVRDILLGKSVNDLDIIVEGDAIRLGESLVKKYGGKLTPHTKFRTAIWHLAPDILDLITARNETYLNPGALPTIKPSTINDDLLRRDFTINAMAVRVDGEHFGELLDPLNGQADLEKKIIRVLHPRSFVDDPTRIFRAIRYEQRYGFILDPSTLRLINSECFAILNTLSGQRIRHEIDLIFTEENSLKILLRLSDLGVFNRFDPNMPKINEKYLVLQNSIPPAEFSISVDRVLLGYLLWLLDSPVEVVNALSKRLDFTSELSKAALAMVQLKNDLISRKDFKPSAWTIHLEKIPLAAIYALWLITNEPALKEFFVKWRHVKSNISGDELKAHGLPPGPRYREILTQLRAAWLDGEVKNAQEEKEFLKKLL